DFVLRGGGGGVGGVGEQPGVENTFRFIKSAFLRRVRGLPDIGALLDQVKLPHDEIPPPADLLLAARRNVPALADLIADEIRRFRPRLVVSQTRTRADLDLGSALRSAGRRRLGLAIDYLGHLETDDSVWLAVRKRRPLVIDHSESRVSKNIERIARRILATEGERPGEKSV